MVYPQIAILIGTSMRKHWSFSGTLISDKAISFTVTGTPMFNSVMCSLGNLLVRMNPPCGPKVRKGMILRYDERYCQVKEWYAHKQGRGAAAYHVTYDELDTGKQRVQKFGSGVKLVKVDPDKQECQAWTIPVDPGWRQKKDQPDTLIWVLKVMGNSSEFIMNYSRMRSKGSRFTLGVWGLRVCSLDVAFTVATVRNRPQPSVRTPYGRAYGKFCRGGPFWRFQTCRCFVSRGRRGTS